MVRIIYVVLAVGAQLIILGALSLIALVALPDQIGRLGSQIVVLAIVGGAAIIMFDFVAQELFGKALFGSFHNMYEASTWSRLAQVLFVWFLIGLVAYVFMAAPL